MFWSADGLQYVGRRWQLEDVQRTMIPPGLFSTLQSHIWKKYGMSSMENRNSSLIHLGAQLVVMRSSDQQNATLIECDMINSNVHVVVRGQSAFGLMSELFEMVEDLLNYYEGLRFTRLAMCPSCLSHNFISTAHSYPLRDQFHEDKQQFQYPFNYSRHQSQESAKWLHIPLIEHWILDNISSQLQPHDNHQQQKQQHSDAKSACPECDCDGLLHPTQANQSIILRGSNIVSSPSQLFHHQTSNISSSSSAWIPIQSNSSSSSSSPSSSLVHVNVTFDTIDQVSSASYPHLEQHDIFQPSTAYKILNETQSSNNIQSSNAQTFSQPSSQHQQDLHHYQVFLCCSFFNFNSFIRPLAFLLQHFNTNIYFDEINDQLNLSNPQQWTATQQQALQESKVCVILMTDHTFDRSLPYSSRHLETLSGLLEQKHLQLLVVFENERAEEECKLNGNELGQQLLRACGSSNVMRMKTSVDGKELKDRFEEAARVASRVLKRLENESNEIPSEEMMLEVLKTKYPVSYPQLNVIELSKVSF